MQATSLPAPLLTVNEIAATLRTAPSTVYRHIQDGRLDALKFGGCVRVSADALDKFLTEARSDDA